MFSYYSRVIIPRFYCLFLAVFLAEEGLDLLAFDSFFAPALLKVAAFAASFFAALASLRSLFLAAVLEAWRFACSEALLRFFGFLGCFWFHLIKFSIQKFN